jgi:hypothetical protein
MAGTHPSRSVKGVVFASAMMLIVSGVDLVAVAPGYWWIIGDVLLLTGLCVFSAMVYRA